MVVEFEMCTPPFEHAFDEGNISLKDVPLLEIINQSPRYHIQESSLDVKEQDRSNVTFFP